MRLLWAISRHLKQRNIKKWRSEISKFWSKVQWNQYEQSQVPGYKHLNTTDYGNAFPEKLCRKVKETEMVNYLFTCQDLRWWSFLLAARADQKTCTKSYGRKGVRSGGHLLLLCSDFFRGNKKKNSLILSHFDSLKPPGNISAMLRLLSDEH